MQSVHQRFTHVHHQRLHQLQPIRIAAEHRFQLRSHLDQEQRVIEELQTFLRDARRQAAAELRVIVRQQDAAEKRHAHRAADRAEEYGGGGGGSHLRARRDILHGHGVDRLQQAHAESRENHAEDHMQPRRRGVHDGEDGHAARSPESSPARRASCSFANDRSAGRPGSCPSPSPASWASSACRIASPKRPARPA